MISAVSGAIGSLVNALSTLFNLLPSGFGDILIAALTVYLIYVLLKVILDIIGIFI